MQGWESNSTRVWDMGPDIVAELRNMREIDPDSLPRRETAFDPAAFQEVGKQPTIEDYRLSVEEL